LVANFARKPQGGDRDQIRAVASGEGDVAVANSYYLAKMLAGSEEDQAVANQVAVVFPIRVIVGPTSTSPEPAW